MERMSGWRLGYFCRVSQCFSVHVYLQYLIFYVYCEHYFQMLQVERGLGVKMDVERMSGQRLGYSCCVSRCFSVHVYLQYLCIIYVYCVHYFQALQVKGVMGVNVERVTGQRLGYSCRVRRRQTGFNMLYTRYTVTHINV